MKVLRLGAGIVCAVFGLLVFLAPQIRTACLRESFQQAGMTGREEAGDLYEEMEKYNKKLSAERDRTEGCPLPASITADTETEAIGTISIPDMDVQLPLYIGASYEHLDKGAAVLEGTSMPVGGEDNNCVILGHRSWCGAPYFRDIDAMKQGSLVRIDNGRDLLYYQAFEMDIILPDDRSALMIRPGEDLVTLVTCHPYLGGGTHRYVVYCRRCSDDPSREEMVSDPSAGELPRTNTREPYSLQEKGGGDCPDAYPVEDTAAVIRRELQIRTAIVFLLVFALFATVCKVLPEQIRNLPKAQNNRKNRRKM